MNRALHHLHAFLATSLVLLAASVFADTAAPPKPSDSTDEDSPMAAFGKMIPQGFVNRGVIIPSFDEKGRKTSELHAESLTRIDDQRLQATQVRIQIYDADPAKNSLIQLPSAVFHLTDSTLRCGERFTVTRADLETSADSLVFDTRTSIGSMAGRVRTLIFDTSAVSRESKTAQPPSPKPPR